MPNVIIFPGIEFLGTMFRNTKKFRRHVLDDKISLSKRVLDVVSLWFLMFSLPSSSSCLLKLSGVARSYAILTW